MADRTGLGSTTLHYLAVRQAVVSDFIAYIHANLLAYLGKLTAYTPENGFQGAIKRQGGPFLGFVQVLKKKLPERTPTKTRLRVSISDRYAITCVGTWTTPRICFTARATGGCWAGPGKEANAALGLHFVLIAAAAHRPFLCVPHTEKEVAKLTQLHVVTWRFKG